MSDRRRATKAGTAELDENSPERRRPIFSLILVTILLLAAIIGFVLWTIDLLKGFAAF